MLFCCQYCQLIDCLQLIWTCSRTLRPFRKVDCVLELGFELFIAQQDLLLNQARSPGMPSLKSYLEHQQTGFK